MNEPVVQIAGSGKFADTARAPIFDAITAAIRGKPSCAVVLAGGNTPRAVYQALVLLDATTRRRPLSSVEFYFGDERCVPPDDPESNFRMAREALGPSARLHRIEAERPDRDRVAKDYEAQLPRELDVLILGIGEDGHTASLFPGSPALDERSRRVVAIKGAPKPPAERITIAPPAIEAARAIFVLATGEGKAEAVERALRGAWNPQKTPAQLARRGTWILDEAAASRLGGRR